jgi:predicted transposase/invertase (TIGR01784 family)
MNNISIHDNFIRSILANRDIAADYFRYSLPASISSELDFSTLTHLPDSYLSKELRKTMSDVVYTCQKKNDRKEIKVSLLVEHKSFPDKYTPVQIGSYIFSALQKQVTNKEPLSVVIPVLLYHGKSKWEYQTLAGLFEGVDAAWEQYIPNFSYLYNDLGEVRDEEVEGLNNKFLAASLFALKYSYDPKWLEENAVKMLIWADEGPEGLRRPFIIYLFSRAQLEEAEIIELAESLPESLKKTVMSTADILIEKGRKEGKLEEARNIALTMKQRGVPVEEISQFTNLTVEEINKLK